MKLKKTIFILFLIMFCFITFLMLIPSPPMSVSGFRFADKIQHAAAFGLLSFLLSISVNRGKPRTTAGILIPAVSLAAYGILVEYFQQFTGRAAETGDVIADLAGIAGGLLLSLFFL